MSAPTITTAGRDPIGAARVRRLIVVATPGDASATELTLAAAVDVEVGRQVAPPGLQLADPELSRVHACVHVDDRVTVVDRASRNGVYVDGVRVARAVLTPGAVIRVGQTLLIYAEDEVPRGVPLVAELPRLRGGSIAMQRVRGEIALAAPRTMPVLVLGETGVGKERVAEELHRQSGRRGAWIPVNCAAIPADLAESELFGRVAGAFTGATGRSDGLFAAADGGTIFLDEIGELPPAVQAKLLRVLATSEVRAVGGSTTRTLDLRVVAATHRAVEGATEFRADLYERLAGWTIRVPPLRDRRDDILRLAAVGHPLDLAAAEAVLLHDWPGNVRELEQTVQRAAILAGSSPIELAHLPDKLRARLPARESPGAAVDRDRAPSADELRAALARVDGNVAAVARLFGKDRRQIYRWMTRHGLAATPDADADADADPS